MHAEALADGQEQGGEDQDGGGDVHEGTGDQQDQVHDQQDQVLVVGQAQQGSCDGIGDLHEGHDPAQDVGDADQEDDHAGGLGGVNNDLPQGLQGDGLVADCQEQSVDNSDGGAFSCGEDTTENAKKTVAFRFNQITEERNLYRDKCNKLIEQKQNHVETRRTVKDIIDSMSDVC